jgi:hypothetical protein
MQACRRRRFPFIAVGLVLMAVAGAPTVIGMMRGFDEISRGETAVSITDGVELAFHPAFMSCASLGILLFVVGLVRAFATGSPNSALTQQPEGRNDYGAKQ